VLRGLPYAAVLALGLGVAVFAGANLSTAYPSQAKPFGWPGTSSFDNAVAMVRPELVLAASVPAVVWGARTLRRLEPRRDGMAGFATVVGTDMVLLWLGVLAGAAIGKWAASTTPDDAFWAFTTAHGLLATAFYMMGLGVSVATRRHALPAAVAGWVFFAAVFEDLVRWQVFRQAGYFALRLGQFPSWFYVAQALSPIAGYRAVLILWRPGFRDGTEHAVLDHAAMPPWMTSNNFVVFMLGLWVFVPLLYASLGWWTRAHWPQRSVASATTTTTAATGPGLASAMQHADQSGVAPWDYQRAATATTMSRGPGNASAKRVPVAPPLRATHQSAASTNGTSPAASAGGGGGAGSIRPRLATHSAPQGATGPPKSAGPTRRNP